MVLDVLC